MNERFWIGLCLLFCAFNLKLLIDDYDQLKYIIVEENDTLYDKADNYVLCVTLETIKLNNELIYKTDEPMRVSARHFLNQTVASIEKKINRTGLFRDEEGVIFNDLVCFPISKSLLEDDLSLELFFDHYSAYLVIHSKGKKPNFYDGIGLDFKSTNSSKRDFFLRVQKQKVYDSNLIKSSECYQTNGQLARSRFTCLYACFQRRNLSLGAYSYNDSSHEFDLNLLAKQTNFIHQVDIKISEREPKNIDQGFFDCLKECPQRDCFYETFNVATVRKLYHDKVVSRGNAPKISLITSIYRPYLSTPRWEFFLQFFGLLTLFTNTSVISIVTFLVVLFAKK